MGIFLALPRWQMKAGSPTIAANSTQFSCNIWLTWHASWLTHLGFPDPQAHASKSKLKFNFQSPLDWLKEISWPSWLFFKKLCGKRTGAQQLPFQFPVWCDVMVNQQWQLENNWRRCIDIWCFWWNSVKNWKVPRVFPASHDSTQLLTFLCLPSSPLLLTFWILGRLGEWEGKELNLFSYHFREIFVNKQDGLRGS